MTEKFLLPKIYPITDVSLTKFSHLEQVEKLVAGGAKFIQLRDKHALPKDFYEVAKEVVKFAKPKNVKIIINDRADIALAAGAAGVHLGQEDLPPLHARRILGAKAIIGFSTPNVNQAIAAVKLPIDYIAIGPIFKTLLKENPDPVVGIKSVKKIRALIGDFPLVAIGGINFENVRSILQSGADSAAVISAILSPPSEISENLRRFIQIVC